MGGDSDDDGGGGTTVRQQQLAAVVGGTGAMQPWMWRGAMRAIECGVRTMAAPGTPVQLQVGGRRNGGC